jgi:hypothetical protein
VFFSVSHCISASRLLAMTNLGNKRYRPFLRSERCLFALEDYVRRRLKAGKREVLA